MLLRGSCGETDLFITCEVPVPTSTDLVSVPNVQIFRNGIPLVADVNITTDKVHNYFIMKLFKCLIMYSNGKPFANYYVDFCGDIRSKKGPIRLSSDCGRLCNLSS